MEASWQTPQKIKKVKREFGAEFRHAETDYKSKWEQDFKEAQSIDQAYFLVSCKESQKDS